MVRSSTPQQPIADLFRSCLRDTGMDGGGLSVLTSTGGEAVYASDAVAAEVERLQFTLGEGPCIDATSSGTPVLVDELDHGLAGVTDRWPVFVQEAARAGVRAIFAFPIQVGAVSLGAMDLYRRTPGSMTRPQLSSALSSVDAVGWAVLDTSAVQGVDGNAGSTSMIVHQAAGMAMVQLGCSIDDALVRLRATAFGEGVPITRLAADIVHGRRRLTKEER
jgi:hypothetical protein